MPPPQTDPGSATTKLSTARPEEQKEGAHPRSPRLWERLETWIAVAVVVLTARVLAMAGRYGPELVLDDAFVSFRYARNLADGLGLVFNAGERVEGYTNFLWTALLAAASGLGLDLVSVSIILSFLATLGSLVVLYLAGPVLLGTDRAGVLLAGAAILAFGVNGAVARYVLAGMETPLFVFLVLLGFFLVLTKRPLAAGLAFGCAALTRPEGLLYLALGAAGLLVLDRREPPRRRLVLAGKLAAAFGALYGPYFAWRWSYYGDLLPNTFYVKSGQLSSLLLERGWDHLVATASQLQLWLPCALGLLAVTASRYRRFAAWGALVIVATAVYVVLVGGDFLFFFGPRFLLPALPVALLLAAAGLHATTLWRRYEGFGKALAATGAIALLAVTSSFSWPAGRSGELATLALFGRGWEEIGRWLDDHAASDAVIAVGAIGRIGYYSERPIVDMLGLTDRHVARLDVPLGGGVPGHEKFDTAYVLRREPDYIVFPRIDPSGRPFLAQWSVHGGDVERSYARIALGKTSRASGPWVLETDAFDQTLWKRGYQAAIYRRRAEAPAALGGQGLEADLSP